jgi:hypothetical protein
LQIADWRRRGEGLSSAARPFAAADLKSEL